MIVGRRLTDRETESERERELINFSDGGRDGGRERERERELINFSDRERATETERDFMFLVRVSLSLSLFVREKLLLS